MSELVWPFRTKDPGQYRRVDQGWDLQGLGPGEEDVLAVRDGTVTYAHDPGSDGAHFGDPYPVLTLDQSLDAQSVAVYYGHTHPEVAEHTEVRQGDVIARTSSPGGGGAPNHWLEIGWWGGSGPIGNGSKMRWYLEQAPVFSPQEADLPLSADDLSKITTIVQQQIANECRPPNGGIFILLAEFWNNQFNPELQKIERKVGA